MRAILDDSRSIFLQISESVEDDIALGLIGEEQLIPSTNQFARHFSINPATAAKGVNLLVEKGIVYKKRGIGMVVATGARGKILTERRRRFREETIAALLREAQKLGITTAEIIDMLERGENNGD